MSVEPEGNTLFIGISYAMLREGYTADEIIEFWQLEDEDQITSIVDSLDFNEDSQYLNEDTEVSDEYYFSQIEYIEEGVGAFLRGLATKVWRGGKWVVKKGKDKVDDVVNKADDVANKADDVASKSDDALKTNRSGPDGSKTYRPGGNKTGAADDAAKVVKPKTNRVKDALKFGRNAAIIGGAGYILGNMGANNSSSNNTGDEKKDPQIVLQKTPTGWQQVGKGADDGNYSVSTQTGADQRPKAPLDTNPYFDNPGLKSYWNVRAKHVKQRAMNPRDPVWKKMRGEDVEKKDDEIVIIEYLLNNGHADTVEEAVYVFTQLDEDYIASILNENV